MEDSPVFEPRTVRDFAEKSVTASFLGDVYIYPIPAIGRLYWPFGTLA